MLNTNADQVDLVSKTISLSRKLVRNLLCDHLHHISAHLLNLKRTNIKQTTSGQRKYSVDAANVMQVFYKKSPANHRFLFSLSRLGWGVLCVAGGGAYYFAKRQVNADRASRYEADMKRKARIQSLEPVAPIDSSSPRSKNNNSKKKKSNKRDGGADEEGRDYAGSPSAEASEDAAPVGHSPDTEQQRVIMERSKYEAAEPYRSRKGNRLS
jgi:Domain of unknown function (DUF4748)